MLCFIYEDAESRNYYLVMQISSKRPLIRQPISANVFARLKEKGIAKEKRRMQQHSTNKT